MQPRCVPGLRRLRYPCEGQRPAGFPRRGLPQADGFPRRPSHTGRLPAVRLLPLVLETGRRLERAQHAGAPRTGASGPSGPVDHARTGRARSERVRQRRMHHPPGAVDVRAPRAAELRHAHGRAARDGGRRVAAAEGYSHHECVHQTVLRYAPRLARSGLLQGGRLGRQGPPAPRTTP